MNVDSAVLHCSYQVDMNQASLEAYEIYEEGLINIGIRSTEFATQCTSALIKALKIC